MYRFFEHSKNLLAPIFVLYTTKSFIVPSSLRRSMLQFHVKTVLHKLSSNVEMNLNTIGYLSKLVKGLNPPPFCLIKLWNFHLYLILHRLSGNKIMDLMNNWWNLLEPLFALSHLEFYNAKFTALNRSN